MARPAANDGPGVISARNAVATAFVLSGFILASWLSRLPHIRDLLDLTPGQLGYVMLVGSVGAVGSLPVAGLIVARVGPRWAVTGGVLVTSSGVALVALGAGPLAGSVGNTVGTIALAIGLFAAGYGMGTWDVAINVEGAAVERRIGRTLMPRLHAGFSLGTVIGAGLGALAAAVALPVSVHLAAAAAVSAGLGVLACRWFLPDGAATSAVRDRAGSEAAARLPAASVAGVTEPGEGLPAGARQVGEPARRGLRVAWREPRTLLMGLLVLVFAFAEGVANDWLAIGLVDGYHVSNATGALGFAVFVAAMTTFRVGGTFALDRWGRVAVLRVSAVLIAAGVVLVVFGGALPVAMAGAVLWGAGAALGFPVGMSAAADDPARAAARVSVVSSIGYTAFLAGPPVLGWLGDRVGIDRALLVVLVAAIAAAVVAGATRRGPAERGHEPAADNRVDAAQRV